jgi:multiple sugar transport system substrate-binding protein
MKKSKGLRLAAILLCMAMMVSIFAACGAKTENGEASGETAAVTEQSAAQPAGSETEPVQKAPVAGEIKYNFWGNADQAAAIQEQIDTFTSKNPEIKVNLDFASWGDYWTKLQTQCAAGSAPDVFAMSNTLYLGSYASRGYLADCGELAKKDGMDLGKYYKAALDLASYDGKLYGMPQDINTIILAYNIDLFNKAGVAVPNENSTWEDILAMAKKLTLDKSGKNSEQAGFDPKNVQQWGLANYSVWIDGIMDPMANSYGEGLVSVDGKTSNLLGDASKKTFQYWYDAIWKYHVSPDFDTIPAWTDIFAQGNCAIYPLASYLLYGYADPSKEIKINYDVIQMPKGSSDKQFNPVQSKGICISSTSANIPAAWEFVKYIASEECYESVVKTGAGLSPIASINEKSFLTASFGPKSTKQVYLDALNNPCPLWQTLRAGDVNTKIGEITDVIMRDKLTVEDGLKKMNDEVYKLLTEE